MFLYSGKAVYSWNATKERYVLILPHMIFVVSLCSRLDNQSAKISLPCRDLKNMLEQHVQKHDHKSNKNAVASKK